MDHTHIVWASDLDRYADTIESRAIIPELIYQLVKQSCPELIACRIPYGDAVGQIGRDGIVETSRGFHEFVPKGRSYWEIGTGDDPQKKASDDFLKRTRGTTPQERALCSFIFVTPRSGGSEGWNETEQSNWLRRRKSRGWKLIRIIDGIKLADWLRDFPAIGMWMAKKAAIAPRLGGLTNATSHWANLISEHEIGDPSLPPTLFTVGREGACRALQDLFEEKTRRLLIFAESRHDVDDFVAGFLAGLPPELSRAFSNRCLYVKDEEAWHSIVETRTAHVLVADTRLGLETEEAGHLQASARRRGHGVVIPLYGAFAGNSPEILKLRSPSRAQIEETLKAAGYSEFRARELAHIGADRISALLRHFRGLGSVPPYAHWNSAPSLALAGLIGEWDGSKTPDRAAIELLLGKGYGEWIGPIRVDTLRSDSPLVQVNEKWRMISRGEAWDALGPRLTDDDLGRFRTMAVTVLSERDPRFDLPKEERFAAEVHGKVLAHSSQIRKGIAETLALLGTRPNALSSCKDGAALWAARSTVRRLFKDADWERWASADRLTPLLAEAAPDEFLDAVELALLDLEKTPFRRVFAEEGGGGPTGWNYMTGLLWALETLAWSPDFLSRVSLILADLASIDPGGNWSNRPSNSLVDIFLPWHVQTTSTLDKRKAVIEAILKEHPRVGWKLLVALLPHNHGATTGSHRPVWQDFVPRDWPDAVAISDYRLQIVAYTELAVELAKNDLGKLSELIGRLPDLPPVAHDKLLEFLASDSVRQSPEADRTSIWESLESLVRRHRKYSDATWALPKEAVDRIAQTAEMLVPEAAEHKYAYLFSGRDFDLFEEKGDYQQQRLHLIEVRKSAVQEILSQGGLELIFRFAAKGGAPHEIGGALGLFADEETEAALLPDLLFCDDEVTCRVVASFIWSRFWERKFEWVDRLLANTWSTEQRAKFLALLPFDEGVWERVSVHLKGELAGLYWENVKVDAYAPCAERAVEKLLEFHREGAAVMCVARTVDDQTRFDEKLATRALLAVLNSERGIRELDNYRTVELIRRLQQSKTSDKNALFTIEWNFLPWLDRFSTGSPVILEERLATDPAFFAEVIGLVFRSKKSPESDKEEPNENRKFLAKNAYKLLTEWRHCPGARKDGTFSAEGFTSWINEARKLTEESGHAAIAQSQIGHVLTRAPACPDGLWIHTAVAETLNLRDTGEMRSGFTTQLFNDRGVHGFTHGQEERELARINRERADALEIRGYTRFATAMREFAEHYERDAERESRRDPFEE